MVEDWLVWMNYSEAEFNLRLSLQRYLFELFEPTEMAHVLMEFKDAKI